jgi:hypothetical protein
MQVYIVCYYDEYAGALLVGNAYYNHADADEEAKIYNGYVLTREVK